jgi:hypothetical protein
MCGVAAAGREAVLDVLDALRLVWVREPVLAHEEVVGEADGAAGHEDLGDGEGRHGGGCGRVSACVRKVVCRISMRGCSVVEKRNGNRGEMA